LGFGALFTSSLGPGLAESRAAVLRAVELGFTFFDTAPAYADSEAVLGGILAEVDAPLVVSTKLGGRPRPFDPQDAAQLRGSVRESLRLLRREVIDILFVHEPDRPGQYAWWSDPQSMDGPVIEVLDDLKRQGLIRCTGLGDTTVTELAHCVRSGRFDVVLTAFNFSALFREASAEVLPAAKERGMGVVVGSVLQQGALGRRYDAVVRERPPWLSRQRQEQLLAYYAFLDELGLPIAEVGIRFALSDPDVDVVLLGPKTARQVEEASEAAARGPLPAEVLRRLDAIAAMVPNRPFEEPMILSLGRPDSYHGPGAANTAPTSSAGG
jgi:aryl-alcohol dehydrogenase-like predicted oxidoreductase